MRTNKIFTTLARKALALATIMMMSMAFTACSSDNNDPTPDPDADKYVDLGLSVKWAKCNLGATQPLAYGNYYAWGETAPKSKYEDGNYKWADKARPNLMTKYCPNALCCDPSSIDGKSVLDPEDDAATANLGSPWRMPTAEEIDELIKKCTWKRFIVNGKMACEVTGPNGKSIVLPAGGYGEETIFYFVGKSGNYWSNTIYTDRPTDAERLGFDNSVLGVDGRARSTGMLIRPVHP